MLLTKKKSGLSAGTGHSGSFENEDDSHLSFSGFTCCGCIHIQHYGEIKIKESKCCHYKSGVGNATV